MRQNHHDMKYEYNTCNLLDEQLLTCVLSICEHEVMQVVKIIEHMIDIIDTVLLSKI